MPAAAPLLDIVFFDVDDTLYSTTEFAARARHAAIRAMIAEGLRIDEAAGFAELSEVVAEFTSNYGQHFGRLLDRLGRDAFPGRNRAVLIAAGVVAYHDTKQGGMRLLPDVHALLNRLQAAGVRMGVITSGLQVKQAEKLVRLGALPYLDPAAIFLSDQMGVGKPNPKIYAKACEAVGVAPGRALYIGDRPTHDVRPAAEVGMRTVHYTGAHGHYHTDRCAPEPDHRIDDMTDLRAILGEVYGLSV